MRVSIPSRCVYEVVELLNKEGEISLKTVASTHELNKRERPNSSTVSARYRGTGTLGTTADEESRQETKYAMQRACECGVYLGRGCWKGRGEGRERHKDREREREGRRGLVLLALEGRERDWE